MVADLKEVTFAEDEPPNIHQNIKDIHEFFIDLEDVTSAENEPRNDIHQNIKDVHEWFTDLDDVTLAKDEPHWCVLHSSDQSKHPD